MWSQFVLLFGLIAAVLASNVTLKGSTPDSLLAPVHHENATMYFEETTDSEERAGIPLTLDVMFSSFIKSLIVSIKNNAKARYWLWAKQTPEDIYKQLKLDGKVENILANPNFYGWVTYIDLFNKRNPNNKVSVVQLLTKTYGDLALAKEIQPAVFGTQRQMANRLIKEQQRNWCAARKSADDVFVMLELDKSGSDIFASLQLLTWYNYVVVTKTDASMKMASVLLKHYNKASLTKMFKEANPHFRLLKPMVKLNTAVEMLRIEKIIRVFDRFKSLHLNTNVDGLLTSPKLKKFLYYMTEINEEIPGIPITQIEVFTHFFGDQALANMLEAAKKVTVTKALAEIYQLAQFRQWLRDGKTQQDIWNMLTLERDTLTTNPNAKIWYMYNAYYKSHYKS